MLAIRPAAERGRTDWGWLDSRHTFSFGGYHDPAHMGFRALRVLNDDRVKGGAGFGTHGHRDMEIFSYVLEGGLRHEDSSGGGGVIRPGEIQFMRAGTGVTHSEQNDSASEPVHCRAFVRCAFGDQFIAIYATLYAVRQGDRQGPLRSGYLDNTVFDL